MRRLFLSIFLIGAVLSGVSFGRSSSSSWWSSSNSGFSSELSDEEKESFVKASCVLAVSYLLFKGSQIGYRAYWMYNLYWMLQPLDYDSAGCAEDFYFFSWRTNDLNGSEYWVTPKEVRDLDHKEITKYLVQELDIPTGCENTIFIFTDRPKSILHQPKFVDVIDNGQDIYDGRVLDLPTMNAISKAINSELSMLRQYLLDLRSASVWVGCNYASRNSVIESNLLDACGTKVDRIARLDLLDDTELQAARQKFLSNYSYWFESISYKYWVAKLFFDTAVAYSRTLALQDKVNEEIRNRLSPGRSNKVPKELNTFKATLTNFVVSGVGVFSASDLNKLKVEVDQARSRLLASWPTPSVNQQQIINDVDGIRQSVDAAIDDFNNNKRAQAFSIIKAQKSLYDRAYKDMLKEF